MKNLIDTLIINRMIYLKGKNGPIDPNINYNAWRTIYQGTRVVIGEKAGLDIRRGGFVVARHYHPIGLVEIIGKEL